jgi:hypothetical protein
MQISHRSGLRAEAARPILARLRDARWITSQHGDHAAWRARNPPGHQQHFWRRNHQLTSHGRQAAIRRAAV